MTLREDTRTVLTLDAGGTNFVFSALRGGHEILEPLTLPSRGHDLEACLGALVEGFGTLAARLETPPVALSFAFPGPADYPAGIIGDLVNLPSFRGGVPLGPFLEARFRVPVFINNDGDLFTYGEAMAGLLPEVNEALADAGSARRYRNLFGITLGTGFGGGLVVDGRIYRGDTASGAEIWSLRHRLHHDWTAEEGASIRGLRRRYAEGAGIPMGESPEPKVLRAIALGEAPGNLEAAHEAFHCMGKVVGDALAHILCVTDSLVVIGGGLSGAAELILPALMEELNGTLETPEGLPKDRLESHVYNLEVPPERARFLEDAPRLLPVPGTAQKVPYDPVKRLGLGLSRLGTSRAVALGAWAFALGELDRRSGSVGETGAGEVRLT